MKKLFFLVLAASVLCGGSSQLWARQLDHIQKISVSTASQLSSGTQNDNRRNDDIWYANNSFTISSIHPNPAVHYAEFNYSMSSDYATRATITIHNVLGSEVARYNLDANDSVLRISLQDYDSGVYFYTLSMNNHKIATKKLIVKK